ncbi:hypothetical protein AM571_CH02573 [Rhizobium etli 8C-3]|uniref:Uncharacterized protein n=1 Tax=Rhizobium etli 8C-3 TaxID=538025 RepID=A0A1L5P5F0_RHIET|nr:hypothetical protein AM571_CH02573 [Rhizobium etli 8C-3]
MNLRSVAPKAPKNKPPTCFAHRRIVAVKAARHGPLTSYIRAAGLQTKSLFVSLCYETIRLKWFRNHQLI